MAAVLVDDTTALFELYSPDYPDIPARTLIAYVDDPFMYDKWENGEDEEYTGYEDYRLSAVAKKNGGVFLLGGVERRSRS